MRASGWIGTCLALVAGIILGSCNAGESLLPADQAEPGPITAQPIDMHSIQVRWAKVENARTYVLERRAALQGEFQNIATIRNLTSYVDRDLEPNTIYGYRLEARNDLGQLVGYSPVAGARTAPEPGIEVSTSTQLGGDPAQSIDSTGYRVRIKGTTTDQALPIEVTGTELFGPLAPGVYTVSIDEVAEQCEVIGGAPSRLVTVTDQGLNTLARVVFSLSCRDRTRGRLRASVTAAGDTLDADGFRLVLSGIAADATLPPSERAVVVARQVGSTGGSFPFENLRPGTYSLLLEGVGPLCAVEGLVQRDGLLVVALGDLAQTFAVTCNKLDQGGNRPFTLQTAWSRDTAAVGSKVTAAVTLDLRQSPTQDVAAFQFTLRTPGAASIVRVDSVVAASVGWSLTSNIATPGEFLAVATNPNGQRGLVPLVNAYYTVTGANGDKVRTQISDLVLDGTIVAGYEAQVRVISDTLVVGTGGSGGTANQPPVAAANGPYTGTAGQAVSFTSAGSSDPDGSIVTYAWTFGDGQSGTGASPTHSYAAAGSYTATLTVTDNRGGTATSQASVTIGVAGPPPTTPLLLKLEFGAFNAVTQTVPLNISLDLTTNLPETPSVEQLQDWVVDSLKWNKDVLQFSTFVRASGTGITNFIEAISRGVLRIRGTVATGQSTGIVLIGTVNFMRIGNPGTSTTTSMFLGPITGAPATGPYNYKPRIRIEEAAYTIPAAGPAPTTVSGTVSSPQLGGLGGVTVTLGSGLTGTTGGNGAYTIANVPAGNYSATVSGLPAGCTAPAALPVVVAAAPVTGANFAVTCPAPTGVTVSGTVTSPQQGPLSGVLVSLGAGLSSTTGANGSFSIVNVAAGSYSATLSGLPAGCTPPAAVPVTVAASPVTGVSFSIACPAAPTTGTLNGSFTFTAGSPTPSLAAVTVTITPQGGSALTTNPSTSGAWTRTGVPAGAGTVTISNLPAGCTAAVSSANYTGLTGGGSVIVPPFSVTCPVAPANQYPLTVTWSAVTGGQATMTVKIDMGAFNDPANNGANPDRIAGFQATYKFPTSRLSGAVCAAQSGFTGTINTVTSGEVTPVLTNLNGVAGLFILHTCTFTVAGTGPTTLGVTGLFAFDEGGNQFETKINVIVSPLP